MAPDSTNRRARPGNAADGELESLLLAVVFAREEAPEGGSPAASVELSARDGCTRTISGSSLLDLADRVRAAWEACLNRPPLES
jgi:hypothetical protein